MGWQKVRLAQKQDRLAGIPWRLASWPREWFETSGRTLEIGLLERLGSRLKSDLKMAQPKGGLHLLGEER